VGAIESGPACAQAKVDHPGSSGPVRRRQHRTLKGAGCRRTRSYGLRPDPGPRLVQQIPYACRARAHIPAPRPPSRAGLIKRREDLVMIDVVCPVAVPGAEDREDGGEVRGLLVWVEPES